MTLFPESQMAVTVTLSASVDTSVEAPGFAQGGVVPGRVLAHEASGKGINLARCLKSLGTYVGALAFVGKPELDFYDEVLSQEGIPHRLVEVPGSTRNNITLLDPVSGLETHIRHEGLAVEKHHVRQLIAVIRQEVPSGSWVAFSGGAPPGMEAGDYEQLIEEAKGTGARVAVDTSGPYLKAALKMQPTLIKPNLTELSDLLSDDFDSPEDIAGACVALLDHVSNVVVSIGAEGAVYVCDEGAWHCKAYVEPQDVRGTVGCGDAVVAGFISAMLEQLDPPARLVRAVACGSAAALWPSAGHINRDDVRRFERLAKVRDLSQSAVRKARH